MVFPIIPIVIVGAVVGGSAVVTKLVCKLQGKKDNAQIEIGEIKLENEELLVYDRSS